MLYHPSPVHMTPACDFHVNLGRKLAYKDVAKLITFHKIFVDETRQCTISVELNFLYLSWASARIVKYCKYRSFPIERPTAKTNWATDCKNTSAELDTCYFGVYQGKIHLGYSKLFIRLVCGSLSESATPRINCEFTAREKYCNFSYLYSDDSRVSEISKSKLFPVVSSYSSIWLTAIWDVSVFF